MLADELVEPLREFGCSVIRASIDGFHNPKAIRYQLGPDSPEGYYRDSFNHEAILACLLHPLGPGGSLRYRLAAYDYRLDTPLQESSGPRPRMRFCYSTVFSYCALSCAPIGIIRFLWMSDLKSQL